MKNQWNMIARCHLGNIRRNKLCPFLLFDQALNLYKLFSPSIESKELDLPSIISILKNLIKFRD
jgi:hypothetical protein